MEVKEELDSELLVEQLLTCAYKLRDSVAWPTLMGVFSAVNELGAYLADRDSALDWADSCMDLSPKQHVRP